ncbi:MAG: diacylglycerol kinase family protein [Clostridiales bacterium]|nr:diacylglycerol kinase family protein [Clostridiales bacterium]
MSKINIYFNGLSGNNRGEIEAKKVTEFYPDDELNFIDITKTDIKDVLNNDADKIVLCGGDGTLNHFVNDIDGLEVKKEVYFFATGSGNDFLNDLGKKPSDGPVKVNDYIYDLPTVKVNGMTRKFINGIGYGIDGYCCEEGDRIRATSDKPVNYTSIAIKGLLFKYKPTNAKVTVDGVTKEYKGVWLAPAMNGRFYGGGMIPTPGQKRLAEDKKLSNLVFYGAGKIKTLIMFPNIFKGEHIKFVKHTVVTEGKHIKVEYDRPVALQIDGETVLNVTEYEAFV